MPEIQTWRLWICPQTHVRTVQGERWIPPQTDEYLIGYGKKARLNAQLRQKAEPTKKISIPSEMKWYNRKWEIKRYWDYKIALREEAERQKFVMPQQEAWLKFYIPMPQSWSEAKKARMCFTKHCSKPDKDNLEKAFLDSLVGKQDNKIADSRVSKFWYSGTGHIEITVGELPPAIGYTKITREEKIK
jgi:Holliday junction resolvase RusA-like endonuclease